MLILEPQPCLDDFDGFLCRAIIALAFDCDHRGAIPRGQSPQLCLSHRSIQSGLRCITAILACDTLATSTPVTRTLRRARGAASGKAWRTVRPFTPERVLACEHVAVNRATNTRVRRP